MRRTADAEARGDAAAALDAYWRSRRIVEAPHGHDLAHLARLGDQAPGWLVSRWVVRQAYHWMLLSEDPRAEAAVRMVLAATYELPDDLNARRLRELGTQAAATDWLVPELAVHAHCGLADFLEVRAEAPLLARASRIAGWVEAPLAVYRYQGLRAEGITVTALGSGSTCEVLHLGCTTGVAPDATVLGRLVQIDVDPGWVFERRPLEIDEQTARDLVPALRSADPVDWLWTLAEAIADGRQPYALGRAGSPPLGSDVVPDPPARVGDAEPAGRIRDLMTAGLDRTVAEAVGTCEVALLLAEVAPDVLPVAASHAAVGLSHPVVFEAARKHSTGPANAAGWTAIATCVPEPVRGLCRHLAATG